MRVFNKLMVVQSLRLERYRKMLQYAFAAQMHFASVGDMKNEQAWYEQRVAAGHKVFECLDRIRWARQALTDAKTK